MVGNAQIVDDRGLDVGGERRDGRDEARAEQRRRPEHGVATEHS